MNPAELRRGDTRVFEILVGQIRADVGASPFDPFPLEASLMEPSSPIGGRLFLRSGILAKYGEPVISAVDCYHAIIVDDGYYASDPKKARQLIAQQFALISLCHERFESCRLSMGISTSEIEEEEIYEFTRHLLLPLIGVRWLCDWVIAVLVEYATIRAIQEARVGHMTSLLGGLISEHFGVPFELAVEVLVADGIVYDLEVRLMEELRQIVAAAWDEELATEIRIGTATPEHRLDKWLYEQATTRVSAQLDWPTRELREYVPLKSFRPLIDLDAVLA